VLPAIEPYIIGKVASSGKSQPIHLINGAGIDRPTRLREENPLKSLRHVARMSRKSESTHKSQ
jgi:hypothetical protein